MTANLFEGLRDSDIVGAHTNAHGTTVVTRGWRWGFPQRRPRAPKPPKDRSAIWLRNAMLALGVLAAAAAVVSYAAQYVMVYAARHLAVIAALEAGIPDAAALIFASLGIALALQGRRAIRARVLNVGAVATSLTMNWLAAGPGWRDAAIWVMPPIAYALASDTAIGVVRAWAIARERQLDDALADDGTTPLAILGSAALWLLRLVLAPPSTVRGFRQWVIDEVRVAPGRTAQQRPADVLAIVPPRPRLSGSAPTKTQRFLALVTERHGDLAGIPLGDVSRISTVVAGEVGLHAGSARTALRSAVLAARDAGGAA